MGFQTFFTVCVPIYIKLLPWDFSTHFLFMFQVGGRLRSRIAEQLINELEFDKHQTIVQLEELAVEGTRPNINY